MLNASGEEITDTTHIGHLNPIRYRSYYYDSETQLYYLKSRYYDPSIGRFISPDDVDYADSEAINGLNLYAYCANNPIMNSDPSGHSIIGALIAAFVLLFTPVGGVLFQAATSLVAYAGFAVASLFDKQIRNDMNAIGWNPFNTSESLVLKSQSVSFYRGRPVFRVAKAAGFSFGALFLGRNADETKFDFVRHEYGHTKQLIGQGPLGYLIKTVIPSVTGYIVDGMGLLAKMNIEYEGLPWEDDANIYGGAKRYQERHNITYWDFLKSIFNCFF